VTPLGERSLHRWQVAPARIALAALAGLALLLPSCESGGHFTVLGYSTKPNYDLRFKTVRVPIFKNKLFWNIAPVVGLEEDLTRFVVDRIQLRTPYKVVQCDPDTELLGTITGFYKLPLSYTQFNYVREWETTLTVELFWRNVRTGELLSRPARRPFAPLPPETPQPLLGVPGNGPAGIANVPIAMAPTRPETPVNGAADPPPAPPGSPVAGSTRPGNPPTSPGVLAPGGRPVLPPIPVIVRSVGHFRPELGQSLTTALQENMDRMAERITQVMEKGW
jgi:hypothetical protein